MDAATFSREATACQRLLYHICWAMMHNEADCADAVQEALLRAWQRRDGLRDPEAFRPWLCRITGQRVQGHAAPAVPAADGAPVGKPGRRPL